MENQPTIENISVSLAKLIKEFEEYKKSGFFTRRDVLKGGILAGLGLTGLVQLANADTIITDTEVQVGTAQLSAHVASASPHSGHSIITSDSFVGDNTLNRAIPHGLGRVPKVIFILITSATGEIICSYAGANLKYIDYNVSNSFNVTAPDATNFYVGNATSYIQSGNGSTYTYNWITIG